MALLLYKRRFDLRSGAGQLIRMQASGLRAAGAKVRLACQRGGTRFFFRTGFPVRHVSESGAEALCDGKRFVVDHEAALRRADIVFVHNLYSEANRHLRDPALEEAVAKEAEFYSALDPDALIVANSAVVRAALVENHGLEAQRIVVHYPGIDSQRFDSIRSDDLRRQGRAELGIAHDVPLIGFVTSGGLRKRGLDIFLDAAERISASLPEARFLVVGSRRFPESAAAHPVVAAGRVFWRPNSWDPERWLASLDLFLYAARYEEFGMVVVEAQALGVPVVTSRRVGATECMPREYEAWLADWPDKDVFAEKALELMANAKLRRRLVAAGIASAARHGGQAYADATVAAILERAEKAGRLARHR